jgi:hypothetical protein
MYEETLEKRVETVKIARLTTTVGAGQDTLLVDPREAQFLRHQSHSQTLLKSIALPTFFEQNSVKGWWSRRDCNSNWARDDIPEKSAFSKRLIADRDNYSSFWHVFFDLLYLLA